ncbi:MAG: undecaprenyldiphospho-muramoylpentapeptide beta-N-acetylglucosaminyltransferase [Clostridia bacterium]|nr:undecaprenyldiphospho-muramoylpentapeptide beta-N-acetylglucosaminyltransferase [Clostridia bacterium]
MKVLLTGGGTAGHINPALAIAETVKQNDPKAEIEFVGIRNGKEADLIPREGYKLHYVESMGIRRSLSPQNIKAVWMALTSPRARSTQKILDDFAPDIVIGTGGYASWPIMKAATLRGIPTAVHESNALPGLTVRRLQKQVDRIWINFSRTAELLKVKDPSKVIQVGNPLRSGFGAISREEARRKLGICDDRLVVLSFGGSLGAEEVNCAVIRMMEAYTSQHPEILHIHAAGKRDFEATVSEFRQKGLQKYENCILVDYIYDMPLRMAAADLVISRAGAMTLSELALMKKAAVLIPSPYVADNHQYLNAKTLADAGAAALIEEHTLPQNTLTEAVKELLSDTQKRHAMEKNVSAFANRDANRRIWEDILQLTEK